MNWVDLVVVGAFGIAAVTGYRRGVVMQVFSWGGFLVGLVMGGLLTTPIVHAIDPKTPYSRMVTSLIAFFGVAFLVEAAMAFGGAKVARHITGARVARFDAVAGSVVAAVLALMVAWFMSAPIREAKCAASGKDERSERMWQCELKSAVSASAILGSGVFDDPPQVLASIGRFLTTTGFPEVFAEFNPSLAPQVDPPPASLAKEEEILAAARLTYKIESRGCGGRVDGSGFPVGKDTVITAAHVVAGTDRGTTRVIEARDAGGRSYEATIVYLDPQIDIAVLRVPGLANRTRLPVVSSPARQGLDGAAIGYPGGGNRTISPARVRVRTDAQGRDIYSRDRVTRSIYVLYASVRQGNSGGPFVDTEGRVRGMIFAASSENDTESYALTEEEIATALRRSEGRNGSVRSTGACAI